MFLLEICSARAPRLRCAKNQKGLLVEQGPGVGGGCQPRTSDSTSTDQLAGFGPPISPDVDNHVCVLPTGHMRAPTQPTSGRCRMRCYLTSTRCSSTTMDERADFRDGSIFDAAATTSRGHSGLETRTGSGYSGAYAGPCRSHREARSVQAVNAGDARQPHGWTTIEKAIYLCVFK